MSVQPETVGEMVTHKEDLHYFAWISLEAVLAGADPAAVSVGAVSVGTTVVPALATLVLVPTA